MLSKLFLCYIYSQSNNLIFYSKSALQQALLLLIVYQITDIFICIRRSKTKCMNDRLDMTKPNAVFSLKAHPSLGLGWAVNPGENPAALLPNCPSSSLPPQLQFNPSLQAGGARRRHSQILSVQSSNHTGFLDQFDKVMQRCNASSTSQKIRDQVVASENAL